MTTTIKKKYQRGYLGDGWGSFFIIMIIFGVLIGVLTTKGCDYLVDNYYVEVGKKK
jgi:hypothetical protein